MSLFNADRRIAHVAEKAGFNITDSGLVVCEQKHISTTYGPELSRAIDQVAQDYPFVFLDLLLAESIAPSYAEKLVRKEHRLALEQKKQLVLVDPNQGIELTIREACRQNGLAIGLLSLFTINPNPKSRISQ